MSLLLLHPILSGLRLHRLLAVGGRRVDLASLLRTEFSSNFLGSFLPSGIGGDLVRAAALARGAVPLPEVVAGVAADRLCAGVALGLTAAGFAARAGLADGSWREGAVSLLPVGAVVAAAGVAWSRPVWRLALRLYRRLPGSSARAGLRRAHHRLARFGRAPRALVAALGLALAAQLLRWIGFWLVARALRLPLGWEEAGRALFPALAFSMVPISVGGWGVREGLLVGLLPLPVTEGLALALAHRGLGVVANLPGAFFFSRHALRVEVLQGPHGAAGALRP